MTLGAPPAKSLGASASRGAAVTVAGQLVRVVIQLVGIIVLARLLTPSDYGVLAMVVAIIGIGEVFRDFGLSSAAIQAKDVTRAQKSNLFWTNTGIGVVLAAVVCLTSGLIAAFYGDPRLQMVAVALSSTFLINGIATQFRADLNRHLHFFRLAVIDICAQVGGLVLGVVLAVAGTGYWALVAQQISIVLLQLVLLLVWTGWFPGLPRRGAAMGGLLRYGSDLVGSQVLTYAARHVDSVVIGATLGAGPLGLYNRAFQLMVMPLNQLNAPATRVALPILSRLQDNRARFRDFINTGQTFMLNLSSTILALGCAQASAVIAIALGPQWTDATPIFQILAVAGFFQIAGSATYWTFLAKGLTRPLLYYTLVTRPIMIAVIATGAIWGVLGVATGFAIATAAVWPVALLWVGRVSDAPVRLMFLNGARTLMIFMTGGLLSYLVTSFLPLDWHVARLLLGAVVLLGFLTLTALCLPAYRRDVVGMLAVRKHFTSNRRTSRSED